MKFRYQARNQAGELQVGFVEAPNKEMAANILLSHQLFVLSLEAEEKGGLKKRLIDFFNRVKIKDLMVFTRQLATLLESEMPLNEALKSLYNQTKNPILKEAVFQILQDIESGLALSQALERQKPIFSDFYISMIRAAEVTGRLEEAISFLASYVEKEVRWRGRIVNALIYPAILMVLFLVVAGIMVAVVFPKIEPIFQESAVDMPFITQIIMTAGRIMATWWWVVLLVLGGVIFIVFDFLKSHEGKSIANQIVLGMPVFGELFKKIYVARFAQSLSVLIKGGVPITQSIEIAASTIGNVVYQAVLQEIASGVQEGKLLSSLLAEYTSYFPIMVSQMTAIGETTGRIDEMMNRVADFYDQEASDIMANLSELIQPFLILFIGVMVALLFASILLPIYNLAQSFKL